MLYITLERATFGNSLQAFKNSHKKSNC